MSSRVMSLLLPAVALATVLWLMWPQRQPLAPITFTLTDGTLLHSEALLGAPVLVSFWSVSCDVCVRDMPKLNRLAQSLADRGLHIVGVAMPHDPPPAVIATVERLQPAFPIALDVHGEIVEAFGGVSATPTVVLLDDDGAITYRATGQLDEDRIRANLLTL